MTENSGEVYPLDIRTCEAIENANFEIYKLNCKYRGEGLYVYSLPYIQDLMA